jgi:hypothetical protein
VTEAGTDTGAGAAAAVAAAGISGGGVFKKSNILRIALFGALAVVFLFLIRKLTGMFTKAASPPVPRPPDVAPMPVYQDSYKSEFSEFTEAFHRDTDEENPRSDAESSFDDADSAAGCGLATHKTKRRSKKKSSSKSSRKKKPSRRAQAPPESSASEPEDENFCPL